MRYGSETEKKRITVREGRSLKVAFTYVKHAQSMDGYVFVEGGTFRMGSTEGDSNEKPVHSVTVGSFLYEGD